MPKITPMDAQQTGRGPAAERRGQTTDDRSCAHGRQELQLVRAGAAVEGELGQKRKGDGEVEGEHADDRHGEAAESSRSGVPQT